MNNTNKAVVRELSGVVLDVHDLERLGAFWGAVLGELPGKPRNNGGWLTVGNIAGTAWLVLQKVPEHKVVKNRVHIDFRVDDVNEAISLIEALGGRRISEVRDSGGVTMADPEGNEFCIGAFRRDKEGRRSPL